MLEKLNLKTLEAILDTIPIDLTFIDEKDAIRYYNREGNRIHKRSPDLVGKSVLPCHKPENQAHVGQVISDLKSGKTPVVEGWKDDRQGRRIHTRYFAVKDKSGKYMGTLEINQDITDIQRLTGEKRY